MTFSGRPALFWVPATKVGRRQSVGFGLKSACNIDINSFRMNTCKSVA
jgi:hypothetical protein